MDWITFKKRLPFAIFNSAMISAFTYLFSNLLWSGHIPAGLAAAGGVLAFVFFLSRKESEGYVGAW